VIKPYLAKITIKNNNIVSLIEQRGFSNVAQFCKNYQISQQILGTYINLKEAPLTKRMEWKPFILKLAEILGVTPGELFTDEQFYPLESNCGSVEMDASEIQVLLGSSTVGDPLDRMLADEMDVSGRIAEILSDLSPRSRKTLDMKFGLNGQKEHTYEEIGNTLNVSRERVRQIESKALRQIRYNPERRDHLKEAYEE